jgi:RimM protein, required for 16S rRNA processing
MRDKAERIVMGRITGIYGLQGWVRVMSYTRPRDNILEYTPWQIRQDHTWHEMDLLAGRHAGKGLIVNLADITDRDVRRDG